jgi:hypothetical protein
VSIVSAAKPKIAAYSFTTLVRQLDFVTTISTPHQNFKELRPAGLPIVSQRYINSEFIPNKNPKIIWGLIFKV